MVFLFFHKKSRHDHLYVLFDRILNYVRITLCLTNTISRQRDATEIKRQRILRCVSRNSAALTIFN